MANWYLGIRGEKIGPLGKNDVIAKIRNGEVGKDDYIFGPGMRNWVHIKDHPEFGEYFSSGTLVPPPPSLSNVSGRTTKAHEIDYELFGEEMQYVEIILDPEEACIAEAGSLFYMEDGIEMETIFGDGTEEKGIAAKLWGGVKRVITGESLFMTLFANFARERRRVAFAAPYPGKIVPLDLKKLGGEIICQKDAFLCAAKGISVGIHLQKRIGAGFFGGEGFILQKLTGDGWAFCHACGTILERTLAPGQTLRIDTGCIVAYEPSVDYDIELVRGVRSGLLGLAKNAIFGGEGLFFATLRGPGKVWLQSLPFSRLADRIYAAAPKLGGKDMGEGSILGGIGDMFMGD